MGLRCTSAFAVNARPVDNGPHPDQQAPIEGKPMCPVYVATALLIAGSSISTGGLAANAFKRLGVKNAAGNGPTHASPDEGDS